MTTKIERTAHGVERLLRTDPVEMTHAQIRAYVALHLAGSPEPVPICYIECLCPPAPAANGPHGYLGDGHFCQKHIRAAVKEAKFAPTDYTIHDAGEEHDSPPHCETCGCALIGTLTDEGIDEELNHFLTYRLPRDPEEWREFSLTLDSRKRRDWTRIREVLRRAQEPAMSAATRVYRRHRICWNATPSVYPEAWRLLKAMDRAAEASAIFGALPPPIHARLRRAELAVVKVGRRR